MSNGNSADASTSPSPAPSSIGNHAPKFGTLVPNRVFVGGISGNTTEQDLLELFTKYGKVMATKVISDRAGVSKGYGFVTFETEEEARKLTQEADNIMLKDRKLNIAPAIKKQATDLGYTKPYSPRLVDGNSSATLLGTNGTVFFGNGTSYAYTSPMPAVLANPSEYHQAVGGVPTPTATHPTFPQVPQTGTPTAVTAATPVGGTPTAAGYPAQFVYPQPMYFPQQYQQYQTTAIQPQWATSPQWRWVSPGAYAQPECSNLNGESLSDQSCLKGTQSSHLSSLSPSYAFSFPPDNHYSSFPISSSTNHSTYPTSISSPTSGALSYHVGTSVTTNTTTTTTAVIGSGLSLLNGGDVTSTDMFGGGPLQIKPLFSEVSEKQMFGNNNQNLEGSQTTLNGDLNRNALKGTAIFAPSCPLKRRTTRRGSVITGHQRESESSSSEDVKTLPPVSPKSPLTSGSIHLRNLKQQDLKTQKTCVTENLGTKTPSPDIQNSATHSMTSPFMTHAQTYGFHPANNSNVVGQMWHIPTPMMAFQMWQPHHNIGGPVIQSPPTLPLPIWPQVSSLGMGQMSQSQENNGSKMSSTSGSPQSHLSGSQTSLNSPVRKSSIGSCSTHKKLVGSMEENLIGKPVLKVDQSFNSQDMTRPSLTMVPQATSPLIMVPCYQYGPVVNPPWCHWTVPQFMNRFPIATNAHNHCSSIHPSNQASLNTLPFPYTPQSPVTENNFCWSSHNKRHPVQNTNCLQTPNTKIFFPQDSKSKSFSKIDLLNKPDDYSQTSSWCGFPVSQSLIHSQNISHDASLRRTSNPLLGEPVRCMRRLAQHPDDKCALLPFSPPPTPISLENVSQGQLMSN